MNQILPPVLVAEDEESDRMILQLAFRKAQFQHPLVMLRDGQDLVDYLLGNGSPSPAHAEAALILLDLKMPRMSGFDVLAWLGAQPAFAGIPVVVLSSSSDESDMLKARQLGAREYYVKPHGFEDLIRIAVRLGDICLAAGAHRRSIHPHVAAESARTLGPETGW